MWKLELKEAPKGDFKKQLVPEGMQNAVCYSVVDLGTQTTTWEWQEISQRKVQITFETEHKWEFDGVEKPLVVGKRYTLSSSEKSALHKDLKSWTGKPVEAGFDVMSLVGKPAQLQIIHNKSQDGKTYANINTIIPSKEEWEPINEKVSFSLEEYQPEELEKVPDRMKEIIFKSPEWEKVSEEEGSLPF